MKQNNINILIAVFIIVTASLSRIVNAGMELHNFVPIAAFSLFSGVAFRQQRTLAFIVPLMSQLIADIYFQLFTSIPGFYSFVDQSFTYAGILGAAAMGFTMRSTRTANVATATVGASFVFFFLSNLGFYLHGWNGYAPSGFIKTFVDAIPYYKNSFVADILGSFLLFGGYNLVQRALLGKTEKAQA